MMKQEKTYDYGNLMSELLKSRTIFDCDDEFRQYAIEEVRQFIGDLRKIDLELTMRPDVMSGRVKPLL